MRVWLRDLRFEEYCILFVQAGYDMPTISHMTPQVQFNVLTPPTVPLLTSPTPSPSNSHPTKSFPNDTPGTVQHPHSVQHSLPHLSLTPFNIPSSTHLPLQPHPTILKITPQVQFYFLTPTPPHGDLPIIYYTMP